MNLENIRSKMVWIMNLLLKIIREFEKELEGC